MMVYIFNLVKIVTSFFLNFSQKVLSAISHSTLLACCDYYCGIRMGYHVFMYNNDVLKYIEELISSAIINGQNKIKYFSRGEKDLLKHKKEDKYY